tara:strand:+ start:259 stop:603 length:345 start_codon:yes stop_codon:yes gene_type:complete
LNPELSMPGFCYAICHVRLKTATIVGLQHGVSGYWPLEEYQEMPIDEAKAKRDELNERLNVTKMVADCMHVGSMFGWDVPGANPRFVMENFPSKSDSKDDLKWLDYGPSLEVDW